MNNKLIGKRLAKLRDKKSQEEVARDLGISTSAYVKYESGVRMPRDEVKIRIAEYFNTDVQSLFYAN